MAIQCWRVKSLLTINNVSLCLGREQQSVLICRNAVDFGAAKRIKRIMDVGLSTCLGLMALNVAKISGVRKVNVSLEIDQHWRPFTAVGDLGASKFQKKYYCCFFLFFPSLK